MKIIVKPTPEDKVVAPVNKQASAKALHESMVQRAEGCVDHLCGCSCTHKGC